MKGAMSHLSPSPRLKIAIALGVALLASARPQEEAPKFDLSKHYWAKWKPGSYVVYRVVQEYNGDETELFQVRRLEEVGAETHTIVDRDFDAADAAEVGRARWTVQHPRFAGRETLRLLGKETSVTLWRFEARSERGVLHFRMGTGPDSSLVKWSWVLGDDQEDALRQDQQTVKADDEVRVGGKTYRALRCEGTFGTRGLPAKITEWGSQEIPGGFLKSEVVLRDPNHKYRRSVEVVEFGMSDLSRDPPAPKPRRADLALKAGMAAAEALDALRASGARRFPCGYQLGTTPDKPRPFLASHYYTLRNGVTVRLIVDKRPWIRAARGETPWPEQKDDPAEKLEVASLAVANSTVLLCNKLETWYPVDSIELRGDRLSIARRPVKPVEPKGLDLVWKGMNRPDAEAALKNAGLEGLALPGELPKRGAWLRSKLPGDASLLINVASQEVATLVVECPGPGERRSRVEFDVADLSAPFGERGSGGLSEEWDWNPDDPKKLDALKRRGHLR